MRPGRRSLAGRRSSLSNRIQEQNPGRLCDRNDAAVTNYSGRHDLASLRSARGSVAGRTSFGRQRAFCVRSSSSIGKQESALESHLGETHVQVHLPSSSQASRSDSNQGRSARFSPAEVVRLQILEGQGKTPTMFARHSNTHHHSGHSVRGPSTSNVMGNVEGPMTEASSQEWQGAPFSLDVPGHISTTQGVVVPRPSLSELINEHLDDSQNRSTATVPSPTNDLPNGSQTRSDLIDAGTSMSRTTRKSHLTSDAVPEHEPTSYAHEEIQENRNKTSAGENGSHQLSEQRSSTPNIGYETNTGRQPADINHGSVSQNIGTRYERMRMFFRKMFGLLCCRESDNNTSSRPDILSSGRSG